MNMDYIKLRKMSYLGIPLSVTLDNLQKTITFCLDNSLRHKATQASCLSIIDNIGNTYTLTTQPISVKMGITVLFGC